MRVLVYSNDHVGSSMAGPGIRSYHFARELSRWFDVTLLTPRAPDVEIPDVEIAVAEGIGPDDLGRRMATFDAVVTQFLSIPTMNRLRTSRTRVVYDLYIPFVERMGFLDSDLAEHPDDDRSEHLFAAYSRLTQRYALAT